MDSFIGFLFLVVEVIKFLFGGVFIIFFIDFKVEKVDFSEGLGEKYNKMVRVDWGVSIDFCVVFSCLILFMVIKNVVKFEDMVK